MPAAITRSELQLSVATLADLDEVMALHRQYHIDAISAADKDSGFVTTNFTPAQLQALVEDERGLFIARHQGRVVAYAMAASWAYWSQWPLFAHMIKDLSALTFMGQPLTTANSYQYGPVCIAGAVRGSGVLEQLFEFARAQMASRYPVLVTFINRLNPRSFAAHTRKLGLEVLQEFEFNHNHYYELAYATAKPLPCGS